ncbi:MAG TPA: choice-of-anchor Q domain-containing protein [Solirubrobacterales bacterium]|nr:choice-of-anchor Q domain-containing protein [Solirubrobacterales bacterium]
MRSGIRTLGIAVGALALLVCLVGSAAAQTYTVTRTDDPSPAPCEPTNCSLRQALEAANMTTTVDDVVVVPASSEPYILQYEELALPIADEVEVRGAGADKTVIKGDGKESIFFVGAKATLAGLTITGGTSAIQSNAELLVRGVSIEGNKWNGGTAGIISNGPLTVESSFLGFNRTENVTGGVIHSNAPVTIVNSTIAQNVSKEGPGVISTAAGVPVSIFSSAVVSNRSETGPMAAVGGTPLTLRNNVFADNRDAIGLRNCASSGGLSSFGGNVSDDGSCGSGATDKPNVNPLLGALALHGGTTLVYELLPGSPAIDAAIECPAVDQRGVARPQGPACDSGPYEYVPPSPPPPGDTELAMRLGKGKLFVSRKGRTKVRLSCPSSEATPPCSGKVKLAGRFSASAKFKIGAGKTKAVVLRLPRSAVTFLKENPKKRKVRVVVRARDGAGNQQVIKQKRQLVPR